MWQLAIPAITSVLGSLSSNSAQKQSDALNNTALRLKLQQYDQQAPLRDRANELALAGRPDAPNLGALFQDSGNPYNRAGDLVHSLQTQPSQRYAQLGIQSGANAVQQYQQSQHPNLPAQDQLALEQLRARAGSGVTDKLQAKMQAAYQAYQARGR